MEFIARLRTDNADQAMLLFQMRRLGAAGEFFEPHNGGDDIQLIGEAPDDKLEDLVAALAQGDGALHTDGRHFAFQGQQAEEKQTIEEAEAHLGGPFTIPGTTRADWSFAGDRPDHLVQALYFSDRPLPPNELREATGYAIDHVMTALKKLGAAGTVRKFRHKLETGGNKEVYGLSSDVRSKLDEALGKETVERDDANPLSEEE